MVAQEHKKRVGRPPVYDEPAQQFNIYMPESLEAAYARRAADINWRAGKSVTTRDQEMVKAMFSFLRSDILINDNDDSRHENGRSR